ncbi:MAG TPA: glycosyltransferase [Catalimonadaceae bacterium]|nr:glycosyltransferase [Catalimonadaceae bacterium]HPI10865.1 glycosyltransferase [Catalimonadaceae bacterium]
MEEYLHIQDTFKKLRVAIVHEWFVNHAGSEKVVEQMVKIFPEADLFALVDFLSPEQRKFIAGKSVNTSFIQRLPFARKSFRNYFPLFPLAVESHDLRAYDLIISSSHMVSKGVISNQNQMHICYCHSPCRYAWDLYHQYLEEAGLKSGLKGLIARFFLHKLRVWDIISLNRVTHFIANSSYIGNRIRHVYRRESDVVYPPVDVERFQVQAEKGSYYFAASRLVPYKKMDVIVRAFRRMPDKKLIVVGSGNDEMNLRSEATSNIEFRSEAGSKEFLQLMSGAKAFVFAAEEDFGITMAEALACGTPVIAFGRGGAVEIVDDGKSGCLFSHQTSESLIDAVIRFEKDGLEWNTSQISASADRFSNRNFRENLALLIWEKWRQSGR